MIAHYVGVDISYKTATVAWQVTPETSPIVREIQQTPAGYRSLIKQLKKLASPDCIHVVMEATSTYWMALAHDLYQAGFVVSVVNPSDVKHFAKLKRRHAKSDALDAVLLLDFAQDEQPVSWSPPPEICERLRQLLTSRTQLMEAKNRLSNQLHALKRNPNADPTVIAIFVNQIDSLKQDIQSLKKAVEHLLKSDNDWAQDVAYLLSIPGIGVITAAWLLVATHGFVRCDTPERAVGFAGLAPYDRDSGKKRGYRSVGNTGHKRLRNVLYMASASAARFNPRLKQFYEQLVDRGKPKKVARCAVARKLIHIAWACVTKQRYFDPNFQQQGQVP